jgi:hypothetical protein
MAGIAVPHAPNLKTSPRALYFYADEEPSLAVWGELSIMHTPTLPRRTVYPGAMVTWVENVVSPAVEPHGAKNPLEAIRVDLRVSSRGSLYF